MGDKWCKQTESKNSKNKFNFEGGLQLKNTESQT